MYPALCMSRCRTCLALIFISLFGQAYLSADDRDRNHEPMLGEVVPDFTADTTQEKGMVFHKWLEKASGYVVFFFTSQGFHSSVYH
ncbi:hypothetical protein CI610_01161 [invertebrate metagenome]|uniref:Uncharacterized protein n=1 Tax=invertebrate metagenome TaxID=1711999 RepID=A0A2H9T9N7_9ZZZZ